MSSKAGMSSMSYLLIVKEHVAKALFSLALTTLQVFVETLCCCYFLLNQFYIISLTPSILAPTEYANVLYLTKKKESF